jgi:hypothetical protein
MERVTESQGATIGIKKKQVLLHHMMFSITQYMWVYSIYFK